ncbi:hypothetical protein ACXZ65_09285 [Streptomyces aculeolatus]
MGLKNRPGVRGALWLLVAVVALVGGVWAASSVGGAWEREREFRAAPECTSVPVRASGCRWAQDLTVRDVDTGSMRDLPKAELVLPSGKTWHVTFRGRSPVTPEMQPGDEVVGLIWDGRMVEVRDADGRRQRTYASPVGLSEENLGEALGGFSIGATSLVGGVWLLVRRGDGRHRAAAAAVRWHGVVMGALGVFAPLVQRRAGWPIWAIPVAWGVVAVLLAASMAAFAAAALRGEFEEGDRTAA